MPGTFVLNRKGVVRLAHVDPDYMRRLEPSVMIDALRAVSKVVDKLIGAWKGRYQ